jgi:hypothetical protein
VWWHQRLRAYSMIEGIVEMAIKTMSAGNREHAKWK